VGFEDGLKRTVMVFKEELRFYPKHVHNNSVLGFIVQFRPKN
jgi:hypothetical protein